MENIPLVSVSVVVGFITAYLFFKLTSRGDFQIKGAKGEEGEYKNQEKPEQKSTLKNQEEMKMVILVRTDINMGKGKAAAQCCHAVLAAYKRAVEKCPDVVRRWESLGQPKVTLKIDSENEMINLQRQARECGLVAEAIQDAGRTQLQPGTRTVCAIGPGPCKMIDLITGHLKLY